MTQHKLITLTVVETKQITPNMQRITLTGPLQESFPLGCEGSYIKLAFDQNGGTDLSKLKPEEAPRLRTYTVRHYHPEKNTIDIDMVRHNSDNHEQEHGLAGRWAISVRVGQTIQVRGPAEIKPVNTASPWFFFVADMTALPALSATLAKLPEHAVGYAYVQVAQREDIQQLKVPSGVKLQWLTEQEPLLATIKSAKWLEGIPYVWCACEFENMRALRDFFIRENNLDRNNMYVSSYWKKGVTEEGHKVMKRQDAAELSAS
ncbi:siderophore-interacting protein [Vibrio sonorensis]|uniref:siderophore-interacting protein n=1 Tax=Vibrio sonorensis TaxID=1004316 RepID=UPI0008DB2061|nr:siderophore-interacting protein [Vibrio sonorensis]